MFYRELQPSAPLRGRISCFWILEHAPEPGREREKILPDGCPELIFNLGAPYRQAFPELEPDGHLQARSFVIGQICRYLEVVPTGPVSILGVRFQPTAFHGLVRSPMDRLTDRSVTLAELGRPELLELESRLHDTEDWAERLGLVDATLLCLLPRCPGLMGDAAGLIRQTHGRLDLAEVAARVGVSTRTLDRRFGSEVGLTPKLYSRQARLQRALWLLSRSPRPALNEIALASGHCDQPHLNREFRFFSGQSPAEFLRSRHELSDRLTGLAVG